MAQLRPEGGNSFPSRHEPQVEQPHDAVHTADRATGNKGEKWCGTVPCGRRFQVKLSFNDEFNTRMWLSTGRWSGNCEKASDDTSTIWSESSRLTLSPANLSQEPERGELVRLLGASISRCWTDRLACPAETEPADAPRLAPGPPGRSRCRNTGGSRARCGGAIAPAPEDGVVPRLSRPECPSEETKALGARE
jgi:hypothetical protein